MSKNSKIALLVALIALIVISVTAVAAWAAEGDTVDAMTDIHTLDEKYLIESHSISDDGVIGIPVDIHVYFDKANHTAKTGYYGSHIVFYVVNTNTERIGTHSDVDIIKSMLDRGYIVAVGDYKNNTRATGTDLDFSLNYLRNKIIVKGNYLKSSVFPSGTFRKHYIVPAGYNVSDVMTFWEADKHSSSGTLEEIVDIWNSDFKGILGGRYVKWTYTDDEGNVVRKKVTDNAVWYSNTSGTVDQENGTYTLVKYTIAEDITDCVNPDGTPIDLSLYTYFIYPTDPGYNVPVMAQHNSSGSIWDVGSREDRPHFNGYLFGGYAGVVYDYLYIPMAKDNSFGYFDGNDTGYVTGDPISYSADLYSDKKINTAAIRYIRYMAMSEGDTYQFDINNIGVYGVSKGGTHPFLGEKILQTGLVSESEAAGLSLDQLEELINRRICSFTEMRILPGHSGESRYQNKEGAINAKGVVIDAGERQPWLTYNGVQIPSGVQFVYASCPNNEEDITEGHAPTFMSVQLADTYWSASYGTTTAYINLCRQLNIPSVWFAVDEGHSNCIGPDVNWGVVTLQAFYDFAGYYLKDDAVKVLYVDPVANGVDVSTTSEIVVKFTGPVSESEIGKVVITSSSGKTLSGSWSALYGDTEWTFTPSEAMAASDTYTVTVPATVKGDNGKEMGKEYTSNFATEASSVSAGSITSGSAGTYVTVTVPDLAALTPEQYLNALALRVYVPTEGAANTLAVYAVDSTSATTGEKVGEIYLKGKGHYSLDVSEYLGAKTAGDKVVFLIKQAKTAGILNHYTEDYSSGIGSTSLGSYAEYQAVTFDGRTAIKTWVSGTKVQYPANPYYLTLSEVLNNNNIIKSSNITAADHGRRFSVSVTIYDTLSRRVALQLASSDAAKTYKTMDTDRVITNVTTVAGQWTTYTLDYTVYDDEYGIGGDHRQYLSIQLAPDGKDHTPIYVDSIVVKEIVTDVTVAGADLIAISEGDYAHKAPVSNSPLALYDASGAKVGSYTSFGSAMSAYKYGYTLKLEGDYYYTANDAFSGFATLAGASGEGGHVFHIDLGGYAIYCDGKTPLINLTTTSATYATTYINLHGGTVFLSGAPLIGYTSSTAAGAGKSYDVTIKDVNLILDHDFTSYYVVSDTAITNGCTVSTNIVLEDCTLQMMNEAMETWTVTALAKGAGSLTTTYTVKGGSIKLDSFKKLRIYDSIEHTTFLPLDGGYTTLSVPSYVTVAADSYATDTGHRSFTTEQTGTGYLTYTLTQGELSTIYGIIPDEYADVTKYPFVIFNKNGEFQLATDVWGVDGKASVLHTGKQAGDGAVVLMRRDYTFNATSGFNNLSQINGTLTIDLGEHTLYSAGNQILFNAQSKTNYDSTLIVKNGSIRTNSKQINRFSSANLASYTNPKNFNIVYENVTFGFMEGVSGLTNFLCQTYSDKGCLAANGNLYFHDCEFDLVTNAPTSAYTIFNGNDSNGNTVVNVYISGGSIKADSLANVTLGNFNAANGSGLTMQKGADGEYVKLYLKQSDTVFGDVVKTEKDGYKIFSSTGFSDTEGYNEFEVGGNLIITEYGAVSPEYAEKTFVAFSGGVCIGASDVLYGTTSTERDTTGIMAIAKKHLSANTPLADGSFSSSAITVQIVLMKDYQMQKNEYYDNIAQIEGTLTIDLNGKTLTQYSTTAAFRIHAKPVSGVVFDTDLIFKNGNIVVGDGAFLRFGVYGTAGGKKMSTVFENVSFSLKEDSLATSMFASYYKQVSMDAYFDLAFKDCSFDLTNATKSITLFEANDPTGTYATPLSFTYKLYGGEIIAASADMVTVFGKFNKNSTYSYERGLKNDLYTLMTLPSGAAAPAGEIILGGATKSYVKYAEGDGFITYALGEKTKYGTIPIEYDSPNDYPFLVFMDGECVFGSPTLMANGNDITLSAFSYARSISVANKAKDVDITILVRKNYTHKGAKFDNFAHFCHIITIDLDGHTISNDSGEALFRLQMKAGSDGSTSYESGILLVGGTVLLTRSPLVHFTAWGGSFKGDKTVSLTLKDLTLKYGDSALATKLVKVNSESGLKETAPLSFANLSFIDCTLDLTNIPSGFVFADAEDSAYNATYPKIRLGVTIKGGEIIMNNNSITWFNTNDADKTGSFFGFAENSSGEYTTLKMKAGAAAVTDSFTAEDGTRVFLKSGTEEGYDVYSLLAPALAEYVPLSNITLYSDFLYNVYLPISDKLISISFAGVEYTDLSSLEVVEIDGVSYYLIGARVASDKAAELMQLKVVMEDGVGSWKLSVVKYAVKLLDSQPDSATAQLCRDILSYVKSAYNYFGNEDRAAEVAEMIDAIIGADYDSVSKPSIDVEKKESTAGLDAAALLLGDTPSFVFYPQCDESGALKYAAELYRFTVNGNAVESEIRTDAEGKVYIAVALYAYRMTDTVCYTIDGTDLGGEYNLKAYYEFAITEGSELASLVARLWKYSESAAAYKAAVEAKA